MKGERNIGGFLRQAAVVQRSPLRQKNQLPGAGSAPSLLPPESRLITGLLPLTDRVAPGRRRRRCRGRAAPLWTCLE